MTGLSRAIYCRVLTSLWPSNRLSLGFEGRQASLHSPISRFLRRTLLSTNNPGQIAWGLIILGAVLRYIWGRVGMSQQAQKDADNGFLVIAALGLMGYLVYISSC